MGADPENPMKTPSLLLLLAAAALASPAAAADPAHRCDVAWLTKVQATPLGGSIDDTNKYLVPGTAAGQPVVIDILNPSKLCDATVWHYLAVLAPVGEPILDPRTRLPIGGVTLRWNDDNIKQDWAAGLAEQIKLLLAIDSLYQIVDGLGRDALTKGDAAAEAAVKSAIAARKDGAGVDKLKTLGLTADAFAGDKGYELVAAPTVAATGMPAPDVKAFAQIVEDGPAAAPATPARPATSGHPAVAARPAGPKTLKAGAAVIEFRRSIIALANALAVHSARRDLMQASGVGAKVTVDLALHGPLWAATGEVAGPNGKSTVPDTTAANVEVYTGASKFITDPAITAADDDSTHASAALSGLDYGLRNLIALRIAAVNKAVAQAKTLLAGRSVAETLAASARANTPLPAATGSAAMAAAVLEHLKGNKDYQDLSALYDANSAKPEWAASDAGKAVTAQLNSIRADAAATTIVRTASGRALQYSIGGQKVTDTGISVADLDRSPAYRENMADAIAQNIASNPWSAAATAALMAVRNQPPVVPPLTAAQQAAAGLLPPVVPAIVVSAPVVSPYDALLKATPSAGFFNFLNPKGSVSRYASKANTDSAATAQHQAEQRTQTESAANDAADAAQARLEAEHSRLAAAPFDPEDSPAVATAKRARDLAAFDAKAALDIKAAHDKVIAADTRYVPSAKAAADLAARRQALNDTVDAAYSDGITRAVASLNALYKAPTSAQRSYAEDKSGYKGEFYVKYAINPVNGQPAGRVDTFFTTKWAGPQSPVAIASCKTALGFKKDGDSGDFKDPSVDNVDKKCGVRDGLVALLVSYKGSNKNLPPAAK